MRIIHNFMGMYIRTRYFLPISLVIFVTLMPLISGAQYFGRNKVVYKALDFKVLKTAHFDIHYYISDSGVVNDFARMAERWHDRYAAALSHHLTERKPLIFYENHADFQQTNAISGFIDPGVQGVTEGFKNRLVMPLATTYAGTEHVLGHEMVHVFQYDIAFSMQGVGMKGMSMLPLWFVEGMAEYMSVGSNDPLTAHYLRDALLRDKLPTYKDMFRKPYDYNPYQFGQAFWAYVGGKYGDDVIPRFYKVALGAGIDSAFGIVLKIEPEALFTQWHAAIKEQYSDDLAKRVDMKEEARLLLSEDKKSGSMNISPSISPNGRYVAYVTEKDLFTIELYLANANNGKIIKRLTRSSVSAHFELRFLTTAGGWSPRGDKFAYIALNKGHDEIVVLDMDSRKIDRRYAMPDVPALNDPSWSPDGKTIVFSGSREGYTDLYLLDVASGSTERLTHDKFADFQPVFSAGGDQIAFVTDRGQGTNFETLDFKPYSLGMYDLAAKKLEVMDIFTNASHINPQFTPSDSSLIFISDVSGYSEIYRYSFDEKSVYKVTNSKRGVSGITELSPAISLAQQTGRLVFSALMDNKFNIYSLNPEELKGEPYTQPAATDAQAELPPAETNESPVVNKYITSPLMGLSLDTGFTKAKYRSKLSLDYVGQAGVGVGISSFGSAMVGGISGIFSDILGNNVIGVGVQMNGRDINDLGGQFQYYNLKHRVQYGGSYFHVPLMYVLGGYYSTLNDVPAVTYEFLRISIDRIAPAIIYPFSQNKRLELEAGVTRYGFRIQEYTEDQNGRVQSKYIEADGLSTVGAFEPSVAFVHDNSFFGYTSPAKGSRYRIELQPTLGGYTFYTALADFRKYIFIKPLTIAGRALHYGRYGPDEVKASILSSTLYLGNPSLIRGYTYGSFRKNEFDGTTEESDPIVFYRLFGNRIDVVNLEVRAPLLGTRQYGIINLPYVPLELLGFFDAGLAYSSNKLPYLEGINDKEDEKVEEGRIPVSSVGMAARVNVFGYIVLQVYYAYPFQRPLRGGHFGFLIEPGW